jgi:hypothetical protein
MSNRSLFYKKAKSRSYSKRQVETRELIERFLIVCEGEKTEPNYFESFRVPKYIRDICGLGANTVSLVKEAVKLRDDDGDYDQVWCVFDRDSFPAQNFNAAIALAKQEGMNNLKPSGADRWFVRVIVDSQVNSQKPVHSGSPQKSQDCS